MLDGADVFLDAWEELSDADPQCVNPHRHGGCTALHPRCSEVQCREGVHQGVEDLPEVLRCLVNSEELQHLSAHQ